MPEEIILKAQTREKIGHPVKQERREGLVPGVLYGAGTENKNISVAITDFTKIHEKAGESTLVDLIIDQNKPVKVLIQEVQLDPVNDRIKHVDFRKVDMTKKVHTEIELKFVGESPAVKELGGILVKNMSKVEVKCLPQDLVSEIEVDISSLEQFGNSLRVADLKIPTGIEFVTKSDSSVVIVTEPRSEEELEKLEEKPVEEGVEQVEKVGEKEKAEKEAEEGESKEGEDKKGEEKDKKDKQDEKK